MGSCPDTDIDPKKDHQKLLAWWNYETKMSLIQHCLVVSDRTQSVWCGLMAQFQVPSLPDMAYHKDILWGFAVSLIWSSWCLEHLQIFRRTGSFLVVTLSYHWRLVKFLLFWLTVDCGFAALYRNLFWSFSSKEERFQNLMPKSWFVTMNHFLSYRFVISVLF